MQENLTPLLSFNLSVYMLQARYNFKFISTLIKILKLNLKANLSLHIKYNIKQLNKLKGILILLE